MSFFFYVVLPLLDIILLIAIKIVLYIRYYHIVIKISIKTIERIGP